MSQDKITVEGRRKILTAFIRKKQQKHARLYTHVRTNTDSSNAATLKVKKNKS